MKKVVINKCFGGFSLSPEAVLWLWKKGYREEGFAFPVDEYFSGSSFERKEDAITKFKKYMGSTPAKRDSFFITVFSPDWKFVLNCRDVPRDHPLLVECVETLKEKANGACAKFKDCRNTGFS